MAMSNDEIKKLNDEAVKKSTAALKALGFPDINYYPLPQPPKVQMNDKNPTFMKAAEAIEKLPYDLKNPTGSLFRFFNPNGFPNRTLGYLSQLLIMTQEIHDLIEAGEKIKASNAQEPKSIPSTGGSAGQPALAHPPATTKASATSHNIQPQMHAWLENIFSTLSFVEHFDIVIQGIPAFLLISERRNVSSKPAVDSVSDKENAEVEILLRNTVPALFEHFYKIIGVLELAIIDVLPLGIIPPELMKRFRNLVKTFVHHKKEYMEKLKSLTENERSKETFSQYTQGEYGEAYQAFLSECPSFKSQGFDSLKDIDARFRFDCPAFGKLSIQRYTAFHSEGPYGTSAPTLMTHVVQPSYHMTADIFFRERYIPYFMMRGTLSPGLVREHFKDPDQQVRVLELCLNTIESCYQNGTRLDYLKFLHMVKPEVHTQFLTSLLGFFVESLDQHGEEGYKQLGFNRLHSKIEKISFLIEARMQASKSEKEKLTTQHSAPAALKPVLYSGSAATAAAPAPSSHVQEDPALNTDDLMPKTKGSTSPKSKLKK